MIYFLFILFTYIVYKFYYRIPIGYAKDSQKSKLYLKFTILACVFIVVIIAFKDLSIGTDTERYYYHYLSDDKPNWREGNISGQELGFRYLQYICRELGLSWLSYSILTSIIIVAPLGWLFYKYSNNIWASFLLYVTIGLFAVNMTGLRQSLAIAMVTIATVSIFEKKYFRFILFVFAAFLFHYSAIVAIVLGLIPLLKYRNKFQLIILLLVPLIVKLIGGALFGFIDVYLPERYDGYESQSFSMNPLLFLMWYLLLIFEWYSLVKNKDVSNVDYWFYVMMVCFVSSIFLSEHVYMASRISYYFENAVVASLPRFIYKFPPSNKRSLMSFLIYGFSMLAFLLSLLGSDTLSISNYKLLSVF